MTDKLHEQQSGEASAHPQEEEASAEWMRFAHEDLRVASAIVDDETLPPRAAGFHSQQAAEKALKAVLFSCGDHPPRIHGLTDLHARLPDTRRPPIAVELLNRLDPWAVVARYPGDVPDTTTQHARELLDIARGVVDACQELIDSEG